MLLMLYICLYVCHRHVPPSVTDSLLMLVYMFARSWILLFELVASVVTVSVVGLGVWVV